MVLFIGSPAQPLLPPILLTAYSLQVTIDGLDSRPVRAGGKGDRFLVVACDGIWNVMTSQEVVDFVGRRIDILEAEAATAAAAAAAAATAGGAAAEGRAGRAAEGGVSSSPLGAEAASPGVAARLGAICEEVMHNCLAEDKDGDGAGCDNMTMMIVLLPPPPPPPTYAGEKRPASPSSAADGGSKGLVSPQAKQPRPS